MKLGFRSVVMAVIIMLALASASIAADPIQLGPAGGAGHEASICPGSSQVFTVDASGSNLHYQWKKGAENVGTDSPSYEATEAGAFTCVVTGDCGEATSEVGTVTMLETTKIN